MLREKWSRATHGRSPNIHRAAVSRRKADAETLRELIDKVYEGSAMSLVLQTLSTSRPTKEELDQVRRLLDQMEGKKS